MSTIHSITYRQPSFLNFDKQPLLPQSDNDKIKAIIDEMIKDGKNLDFTKLYDEFEPLINAIADSIKDGLNVLDKIKNLVDSILKQFLPTDIAEKVCAQIDIIINKIEAKTENAIDAAHEAVAFIKAEIKKFEGVINIAITALEFVLLITKLFHNANAEKAEKITQAVIDALQALIHFAHEPDQIQAQSA